VLERAPERQSERAHTRKRVFDLCSIYGKIGKKYHLIDVVTASGLAVTLANVEEEACVGPLALHACVCA